MKRVVYTISMLLLLLVSPVHAAENVFVFSTAPTLSKEKTIALYQPLMNYLSVATGRAFMIEPATNFISYSANLQADRYDLVFDGPHLNGWRIANKGHIPIVRLPGEIKIAVIGRKDSKVKSLKDIEAGHYKACAFSPPNLLTMAFLSHYSNPISQPTLIRKHSFNEIISCVEGRKAEVAVLPDKVWNKMAEKRKSGLKLIAIPEKGYPERTFSVSTKVSKALRQKITEALLSDEGLKASKGLLAYYRKEGYIVANADDYAGLDQLLVSIWGF